MLPFPWAAVTPSAHPLLKARAARAFWLAGFRVFRLLAVPSNSVSSVSAVTEYLQQLGSAGRGWEYLQWELV